MLLANFFHIFSSFQANLGNWKAFEPRHFADLFEELRLDLDMEVRLVALDGSWNVKHSRGMELSWCDLCEQDGITLQQMLDVGILDHLDTLERISVKAPGLCFDVFCIGCWRPRNDEICCFVVLVLQAQKEYGLKTALAMMKKEPKPRNLEEFVKHLWNGPNRSRNVDSRCDVERILSPLSPCFRWRPIEFGLVPHRSGTYMVKGIDEIQARPQRRTIECFLEHDKHLQPCTRQAWRQSSMTT